ncbi:cell division protein FtsL [Idiomarina xiamenensis]|uniref:Cell division protein FtsL n=1 Tax=Idiomarina xiamenensis 10-D-4 TaxID=740709 RepID=K2KF31_9GAMM|nr:cell division protein FtsL [Idiomarina xiamenensis]EKE85342.1 cell division protein, FtsL [Idiomarina xiamenensis 10-D-4]
MKHKRVPSLLNIIRYDLKRQWLALLLFITVLSSALMVIYVAHLNRNLIGERDQLQQARDQLDIEWRHLTIEQNALTEHSRVERIAQRQLQMSRPEATEEVLVPWP